MTIYLLFFFFFFFFFFDVINVVDYFYVCTIL